MHGGQHAAWCWEEHFLDFFAADGYRAIELSLSGHGTSTNSKPPQACSIADYVEDVRSVADQLPQAPVVIGHSLGGFVVQKYLDSHPAGDHLHFLTGDRTGGGHVIDFTLVKATVQISAQAAVHLKLPLTPAFMAAGLTGHDLDAEVEQAESAGCPPLLQGFSLHSRSRRSSPGGV